jgi:hypothetical protein
MNADSTRSVRIQSSMKDLTEGEVHVGFKVPGSLCFSEKEGYLCHCVLSALHAGPAEVNLNSEVKCRGGKRAPGSNSNSLIL